MSEKSISDAINEAKLFTVKYISVRDYEKHKTVIAYVDYWHKDTENVRDILNRDDNICIVIRGNTLDVRKFMNKSNVKSKVANVKNGVDEFGRDMPRENPKPILKPYVDQELERRASENAKAASDFIAEYVASNVNYDSDEDSLAKNAPENVWKISEMLERREIEERENYLYALRSHCNDEEEYAFYEGTDLLSDVSDE